MDELRLKIALDYIKDKAEEGDEGAIEYLGILQNFNLKGLEKFWENCQKFNAARK